MARIRIDDLPATQELTPEELAQIFGAGRARLGIEHLETRELMAANLTANLSVAGLLRIEGTPASDQINVQQNAGQISVQGIAIQTAQGAAASVGASAVSRIEISALGGDDQIWVDLGSQSLNVPVALIGGQGNDLFYSNPAAGPITITPDILKAIRSPSGVVYDQRVDGGLYVNGGLTWTATKDFTLAGSRIQLMLLEGVGPGQQLRTHGNRSLVSSCTGHFADNQYAYGPIVLKRVVPVLDDDTPEALVERMFTQAVRWRESHGWHSS